jgi:hypothetical protein
MAGSIHGTFAIRTAEAKGDEYSNLDGINSINCGEDAAKHFLFEDGYRNLNHGSYSTRIH